MTRETENAAPRTISAMLIVALAVGGVAMLIGYNIKDLCTRHEWDGYQYRTSCYNDVYALFFFRGLEFRPFPYVHGDGIFDNERRADGSTFEMGDLEYPALTGVLVGVVAEIVHGGIPFFRVTSGVLALFGFASIVLLGAIVRARWRLLFFAAAPALVLYAFHNWDLFAVALMCAGLVAFHRRADGVAGVWLGLGAAAKVFPGLLLPALLLARYRETGRVSRKMLGAAAGAFVLVNIPFALIDRAGWWGPWKFQSTRFPNFETSWYNIYRHLSPHIGHNFWVDTFPGFTSYASAALFVVGVTWLLWAEARRTRIRPYATSMGILLIWLLTAKVYSPQYSLWVLPFFVLVEIPWPGFAAFTLTDAAVWFAVSRFFLAYPPHGTAADLARWATILEILVYVRYAALIFVIWLTRRAEDNVLEEPALSGARPASMPAAPVEFST
ncbi:MAG: glycosyltransferase 87 family protein [Actinomycetota bacterium]